MSREAALSSEKSSTKTLAERGGPISTFGGVLGFVAVSMACIGAYMIVETLAHPLTADAGELVTGAFILGIAATILCYLAKSVRKLLVLRLRRR